MGWPCGSGRPCSAYSLEMPDVRERLVEAVEEPAPLLVLGGSPESDGVVLQGVPFHEQQVGPWRFEGPGQGEAEEARHGGNDCLCPGEGGLKFVLKSDKYRQQGMFGDHPPMMACGCSHGGTAGAGSSPCVWGAGRTKDEPEEVSEVVATISSRLFRRRL